jgi:hypothetical protein
MISVTPYGSRVTWAVCPDAARAFGTTAEIGFIHSFNCIFVNSIVARGAATSKTFSSNAVLKSLLTAS